MSREAAEPSLPLLRGGAPRPSERLERERRTERALARIRAGGAVFALVQVLTYYRTYPSGIEAIALGLVATLGAGTFALWLAGRGLASLTAARRLALAGLALDAAVVTAFVFVYTFDPQTAIWALLFVVPLEAALRFGFHGAMATMTVIAGLYAIREAYGAAVYGNPLLATSITFRMGIGFIVAAFSGTMASHGARDRGLLEASVERQESMLGALGDLGEGFLIIGHSGILDVNEALTRINGYDRHEMIGAPSMFQFLVEEEVERVAQQFRDRLSGHGVPDHYETAVRHKDGRRVDIEVAVKTLSIDGEAIIVAIVRDISERKRLEAALLARYEHEHETAERLRELDEMKNAFLNAVSHELRTPLTPVIGLSATLAERGDELSREDIRFLSQRLSHNATRLERLLSDLLDLDRLTRGIIEPRRHPTALATLVVDAANAVRNPTHRIDLSEVADITADVDPAMTERIVENLVANAVKHTPEGSTIWVGVCMRPGGVLISVEDDGAGVPVDSREAVFEPFRHGTPADKLASGTGIGLSLVAQFAKLHGGRAWVEGRDGGGAAFRVLLPAGVVGVLPTAAT